MKYIYVFINENGLTMYDHAVYIYVYRIFFCALRKNRLIKTEKYVRHVIVRKTQYKLTFE